MQPRIDGRLVEGAIEVVHNANILDVKADYLLSSGNQYLNMSGGVNGALLLRFGDVLQSELHAHLKDVGAYWMPPGYCYKWQQSIGEYEGVVYCVTVDAEYNFSPDLVQATLLEATKLVAPRSGQTVAFPAFGTGYGHLSKSDFGAAIKDVSEELLTTYPGTKFILVERNIHAVDELREAIGIVK